MAKGGFGAGVDVGACVVVFIVIVGVVVIGVMISGGFGGGGGTTDGGGRGRGAGVAGVDDFVMVRGGGIGVSVFIGMSLVDRRGLVGISVDNDRMGVRTRIVRVSGVVKRVSEWWCWGRNGWDSDRSTVSITEFRVGLFQGSRVVGGMLLYVLLV